MNEQKTKKARNIIMMITIVFIAALIIIGGIAVFFADPPETSEPQDSGESEGKGEGGNTEKITSKPEDIPFINAALRSYFLLKDGEELTDEMLSEVKSISISQATYTHQKEGYYLLDVYINGDNRYGGAVELIVEKSRHEAVLEQLIREEAPQIAKKRFDAYYLLKDPSNETLDHVKQQILEEYPISATTPLYVLTTDIKEREIDELASFMAQYTDFFDDKYIKTDEKLDGSLLSCYPNLEEIFVQGVKLENAPDGVRVLRSEIDTALFNQTDKDSVEKINVTNEYGSYVLRYDYTDKLYTVNGKSDGYDQKLLADIFVSCIQRVGKWVAVADDPAEYKLDAASAPVRYTVTRNDGAEYTLRVNQAGGYRMFDGDSLVYTFDSSQLLRSVEELRTDEKAASFNSIVTGDVESIEIKNEYGSYILYYDAESDKYSINGESDKYDQNLLKELWYECSDHLRGFGTKIIDPQDFGLDKDSKPIQYTVKLKDGTEYKITRSHGEQASCNAVIEGSQIAYEIAWAYCLLNAPSYFERDFMREEFDSIENEDISSVKIHNNKGVYTLTYDIESDKYCVDGKSEGYYQDLLKRAWVAATGKIGVKGAKEQDLSQYHLSDTPEQYAYVVKYTVTLKDGRVYSFSCVGSTLCFEGSNIVYGVSNKSIMLQSQMELYVNEEMERFNKIQSNDVDCITVENSHGKYELRYVANSDKYSIDRSFDGYDKFTLEKLWRECLLDYSPSDMVTTASELYDAKCTVTLKDGTEYVILFKEEMRSLIIARPTCSLTRNAYLFKLSTDDLKTQA